MEGKGGGGVMGVLARFPENLPVQGAKPMFPSSISVLGFKKNGIYIRTERQVVHKSTTDSPSLQLRRENL